MATHNHSEHYHTIVVGSGQGGKPLAVDMAKAGYPTALIESSYVGGTCVNIGCTPTKTMVASARVAYLARRARDYGVILDNLSIDMSLVRDRKRRMVESFRSGSEKLLDRTANLELLRGHGRFIGPKELEVKVENGPSHRLTGDHIIINTGSRPARPPVPGLESINAYDSTSIMELDSVPDHLVIIGGGYIGLEFGQMFRRFGSAVTIVERAPRLASREDEDVCESIAQIFREDGIAVMLNCSVLGVRNEGGGVRVSVRQTANESEIDCSHLLIAVGRTPNTDDLGLQSAGISLDERGYVMVDDYLRTGVENVYAIGDVTGGPAFTHIAYDDYRIVKSRLLGEQPRSTRDRLVPYTVYIDPQLGRVGLSESEARRRGIEYQLAKIPMSHVARALETDETLGLMKALVDPLTEQILGCAVLGIEGGEIMSLMQTAMMGKVRWPDLHNAVFAHPTLAESLNNLFATIRK